jgi:hypothetical protein
LITPLSCNAATIVTRGQWTDTCGVFGNGCGTHGTMTFTGSTAITHAARCRCSGRASTTTTQNLLWLLPPWFLSVDKPYTVLQQRELQDEGRGSGRLCRPDSTVDE